MKKETVQLFDWLVQTKALEKILPDNNFEKIIMEHGTAFFQAPERYELLNSHLPVAIEHQIEYWCEKSIRSDIEIKQALRYLMQTSSRREELVHYCVSQFLTLPNEVRADFYQHNFLEIRPERNKMTSRSLYYMFGSTHTELDNTFHHNLHTLVLASLSKENNHDFLNKVVDDMQKTLGYTLAQKYEKISPGLVYVGKTDSVVENWHEWGMDENIKLKQYLVNKVKYRGIFKVSDIKAFQYYVKKEYVPADITFTQHSTPVMVLAVNKLVFSMNTALNQGLVTNPRNNEEVVNNIKNYTEILKGFLKLDTTILSMHQITELLSLEVSPNKDSPEFKNLYLDFKLTFEDVLKNKSLIPVIRSKTKI